MLESFKKKFTTAAPHGGIIGAPGGSGWRDVRGAPPPLAPTRTEPGNKKKPVETKNRREMFEDALKGTVDLKILRQLAEDGIPDDLRGACWKLLLGYLPHDRSEWDAVLKEKRKQYKDFCDELIVIPDTVMERLEAGGDHKDHPLNLESDSLWAQYQQNQRVLSTVDVDIPRTMPSLHFFNHGDPDGTNLMAKMETYTGTAFTRNQQHLRRLLFVFVKLNPGLNYVQGMNELSGHLFYTFANSKLEGTSLTIEEAEADAFFCFSTLISHLGDNFCRALDRDELGIQGSLNHFVEVLHNCDPELCGHLEEQNLKPAFYAFRWITLLLSQEFIVPDVLRIWDFLFSDVGQVNTRVYFAAAAMVISIRADLLSGDFSSNMQLLQDFPPTNVDTFLLESSRLIEQFS